MLEPFDKGLLATTLRYPYEVRDHADIQRYPRSEAARRDDEARRAHRHTKAGHFDPKRFEDHYEKALTELLKRKQAGKPKARRSARRRPAAAVINLMDALRASINDQREEARRRQHRAAPGRRPRKRRPPVSVLTPKFARLIGTLSRELRVRGIRECCLKQRLLRFSASSPLPDAWLRWRRSWAYVLWITDRLVTELHGLDADRILWYRPPSLVLGVGCERGIAVEALEAGLTTFLTQAGFARASITTMASLDRKADEPGMLELARRYNWQTCFYSAAELSQVVGMARPSRVVEQCVGTPGVASRRRSWPHRRSVSWRKSRWSLSRHRHSA